jgi:hypothetical protein
MRRSCSLWCVLAFVAFPVAPVQGQRVPPGMAAPVMAPLPAATDPRASSNPSRLSTDIAERLGPTRDGTLILVGTLAAGSAAALGALLGYELDRSSSWTGGDDPGLGGLIVGWVVGPAVVTPGVVHVVNRGHGSGSAAYGAAALLALAGIVAAHTGEPVLAIPLAVGAPLLQVVSAVLVTRATEPGR